MATEINANSFEELNSPDAPENFENSPLSGLSSAQNKDVFFPKGASNAELPTLLLDNAETAKTGTQEQAAASGDSPSGVGGTDTPPSGPSDSPLPKPFGPRPASAPDSEAPSTGGSDSQPAPRPAAPLNSLADAVKPSSKPEAPASGGGAIGGGGGDTQPAPRATNSLADALKPVSGSEAPSTGGNDTQPAPRPAAPLNSLADAVKPSSKSEAPATSSGDTPQPAPRATIGPQSGGGQPSRSDSGDENKRSNTASTNKETIRSFLNALRRN